MHGHKLLWPGRDCCARVSEWPSHHHTAQGSEWGHWYEALTRIAQVSSPPPTCTVRQPTNELVCRDFISRKRHCQCTSTFRNTCNVPPRRLVILNRHISTVILPWFFPLKNESLWKLRAAAVNFNTYRNLKRHCAVLPVITWLSC